MNTKKKEYFIKKTTMFLLVVVALFLVGCAQNQTQNTAIELGPSDTQRILYFWGDGCPICAQQAPFLDRMESMYDIEIIRLEVYNSRHNQALFQEVADHYGITIQGVPTTFFGDRYWVGFNQQIASDMEAVISACVQSQTCLDTFGQDITNVE